VDRREFHDAAAQLRSAHRTGAPLCKPFAEAMPGTRVSLSTFGASFGDETLCASDAQAARLDELQIDLGEGPSWHSVREKTILLEADLRRSPSPWPMFADAIAGESSRAVLTLPLSTGLVGLGAVGIWADDPKTLSSHDVATVASLVAIAATQVLRRTFARMEAPQEDTYSRREVHQATGMVVAQLQIPSDEALLIIEAHAFAAGTTVRALASDIVARRVDLSDA
jgi:hypothetical protein